MNLTDTFKSIADAIRGKTGKEDKLTPAQMVSEIEGIQTGSTAMEDSLVARSGTQYVNDRVTTVGYQAFRYYQSLTGCSFAKAKTISSYAFAECQKLKQVDLPSATSIGERAFFNCNALKNLHLPKVASLEDYALIQNGLVTVRFDALSRIAAKTFSACKGFSTLILTKSTIVALANINAFDNTLVASGTGYIYVPRALLSDEDATKDYRRATNWITYAEQFRAIEDYPDICGVIV